MFFSCAVLFFIFASNCPKIAGAPCTRTWQVYTRMWQLNHHFTVGPACASFILGCDSSSSTSQVYTHVIGLYQDVTALSSLYSWTSTCKFYSRMWQLFQHVTGVHARCRSIPGCGSSIITLQLDQHVKGLSQDVAVFLARHRCTRTWQVYTRMWQLYHHFTAGPARERFIPGCGSSSSTSQVYTHVTGLYQDVTVLSSLYSWTSTWKFYPRMWQFF